jgi:hypothetical protein
MNETFVIIPLEDGTFSIQRWNTLTGQYEPMQGMTFADMEQAETALENCRNLQEENE